MVIPLLLVGIGLIATGGILFSAGRSIQEGEPWYPGHDLVEDVGPEAIAQTASGVGLAAVALVALFLLSRK